MKKFLPFLVVEILVLSGFVATVTTGDKCASDTYDLLIITPQNFVNELQPLVDHKTSHNVDTVLKTVEEIYSDYEGRDKPEQIKYFIKHAIETWDVQYVLLIGGRKPSISGEEWLLPVRYSHIEDNVWTPEDQYIIICIPT